MACRNDLPMLDKRGKGVSYCSINKEKNRKYYFLRFLV